VVEEVVVRSAHASGDFLSIRAKPWDDDAAEYYEGPTVMVELSCQGLRGVAVLPAYVTDAERLQSLFHEIDRDWRGWSGAKAAGVEGRDWLWASATHDGQGHVALTVGLSAGWPDTAAWVARGTLHIDVGSVAAVAADMDRWVSVVWPPEHRWREPSTP
jgi:hypothetical protein